MTDEVWEEGEAILTTAKNVVSWLIFVSWALIQDTYESCTDGTRPE